MDLEARILTGDEGQRWDELVAASPQRTIFGQRWWMDIVTGGGVRLLGVFSGERLVAGLPVWPCRTLGVARLRQPPLTPYWGPVMRPLEGKPLTRANAEMSILRAMAEALAPWPDIAMQWHHSLANWLPFHWQGFTQTTRFTYRLPDLSDLGRLEKARHDAIGQQIRRAQREGLRLQDGVDPSVVARLNRLSMDRQGIGASEEIQRFWPALSTAASARDCLFTTAAVDDNDVSHAAIAIVWDDRSAYAIFNGTDPRFRNAYGGTLTMWRAIEFAAGVAPEFDFEGSTVETVEQFYRRFGGTLCPYYLVTRSAPRLKLARMAARVVRKR